MRYLYLALGLAMFVGGAFLRDLFPELNQGPFALQLAGITLLFWAGVEWRKR